MPRSAGTDSDGSPPPPPTRAGLKAWWKQFTVVQRAKTSQALGSRSNDDTDAPRGGVVFGVPLRESLKYASVQISTANANGDLYVWGYIPVVVAKCGLYLKENATEVPGTFRVSGSSKRMRELQNTFEKPPKYGKSLDWKKETYTTHDVASVFRRYLTQMPEPVIPYQLYHQFRNTMSKKPFDHDQAIKAFQGLIRSMPHANQYLLLYVLDLLSVFARKSDINLMPASNLALIFRPGLIAHPSHELSPEEHRLSLEVLEFLIAQQDYFMMDLTPPPLPSPLLTPPALPAVSRDAEDDVYMVPSSSDEDPPEGGWKLVERASERVQRRRTTSQSRTRHSPAPPLTSTPSPSALGPVVPPKDNPRRAPLSPVPSESSQPTSPTAATTSTTVKRSRTVPSRKSGRSGGGSSRADEIGVLVNSPPPAQAPGKAKVLSKKQKRLSHRPQAADPEIVPRQRAVEAPT